MLGSLGGRGNEKMKTARLIVTFTDLQLRNHLHSELPYPFIKTFNF